jgi:RNA polymerase-binding transcription factor DksA
MKTAHFKKRLEEEKEKLEQELSGIGRRNPSNPSDWEAIPPETGSEPDPTDTADQVEDFAQNRAILRELEIRYNEVLAALERIEKKTYGKCEVGGQPIEERRLEADPAARTCLNHVNQK